MGPHSGTSATRQRRVTQQDVADRVGISRATVSAAISGARYVTPELKQKIMEAIEELHYIPDIVARSMKTNRTMTIGLVLPNILSPIWATVARGVEDVARQAGFSTIICDTDERSERMQEALRNLQEKRVDGIILAPCGACAEWIAEYQAQASTAIVLVDRELEGLALDTVISDGESGTYQGVKHLWETGHRRIGIITLALEISTGRDRLQGYRRALTEGGAAVDEQLIVFGGRGKQEGYEGAERLLGLPAGQRPDALFVCSHLMTVGALTAIREHQLHVPADIALIGFDDLPWTLLMEPPLTVVDQPAYDMGARAAELLSARLTEQSDDAPKRIVLETRLVHRQSCCRLNHASHPQ